VKIPNILSILPTKQNLSVYFV